MDNNGWETWKNYVLDKLECIERNVDGLTRTINEANIETAKILAEHSLKLRLITCVSGIIFSTIIGILIKILLEK